LCQNLGGQAAQPNVNLTRLKVNYCTLPNQALKRRLFDPLAYDDLIENNRRRMALLEDAARQPLPRVVVRLRFPGHEHTTITDGVPTGGSEGLRDLCQEIRETVSPDQ